MSEVTAWALVSITVIAATAYLCIAISPWFIFMMLYVPSYKRNKDK